MRAGSMEAETLLGIAELEPIAARVPEDLESVGEEVAERKAREDAR